MTKTYTKNDLIQYLFGETDQEKTQQINIARLEDNKLDEEIDQFESIVQQIESLRFAAPQLALENIRLYSKNYSLESVQ